MELDAHDDGNLGDPRISRFRTDTEIEVATAFVWEFFALLRKRYPDLGDAHDRYIEEQDVSGSLKDFRNVFLPPRGECLVARDNGDIVGIVMLKRRTKDECELNRMFVRENARGSGLGRALAKAMIGEARALGYRRVELDALNAVTSFRSSAPGSERSLNRSAANKRSADQAVFRWSLTSRMRRGAGIDTQRTPLDINDR